MKRKLTAVLLTLCMVLGMLPMSAFAVWTIDGAEKAGLTAASEIDVDGNHYYLKEGETLKDTYEAGDQLTYYTADKTGTITLVWKADGTDDVTHDATHTVTWTDNSDGTHTSACGIAGCDYEPVTENHTWDEGEVTTAATCGTAGVKTFTCTKCDATKTEEIPATGEHTEVAVDNEDGTHTVTCSVCDTVIVENEKHTFENGKCTVCEAVDPASIPAEKVDTTVDEATGKVDVTVDITEEEASAAVDAAVEAAGSGETAVVTIPAVAGTAADVKEVAVPIPETLVTAIADKDVAVAVETNLGKVSVPAEAFAGEQGVTLTVSTNEKAEIKAAEIADDADETVTAEAVEAVKTAPVISIDLTNAAGDKLASKDNAPTAKIEIDIAVTVPSGWQKAAMWWVDHVNGKISSMKKIASVVDGRVKATLDHLSDYVLLEDTTEEPPVDENNYYSLTVTQVAGATIVVECDGDTDENGYYAAGSTVTGKITFVEGKTGKVTVNGAEVAVDAEGNFSFTLNANTVVTAVVEDETTVEELEVEADTSDAKLDSYTVKGLTAGQTFAYYIQNAEGAKVVSGSFVITGETFTQAVEKGFTYRVWTIDDTVTAVQIWNGDVDGTKYTGYYDSNPEEL